MSSPYLSEIRIMSFNFAPRGWAMANGQLMAIQQNAALFSLLGTVYGGDGVRTFAMPNLQGRVPIGTTSSFSTLGQVDGEETHTLNVQEMPAHNHPMVAMNVAAQTTAGSFQPGPTHFLANAVAEKGGTTPTFPAVNYYGTAAVATAFGAGAVQNAGGGGSHENRQPYLVMTFCIALQGVFPSRS